MGPDEFAAVWARGAELTIDEAAELTDEGLRRDVAGAA